MSTCRQLQILVLWYLAFSLRLPKEAIKTPVIYTGYKTSPLIALMKDQVASLTAKRVRACYIGGEVTDSIVEEVNKGQYQIVFSSPETILRNEMWREMLNNSTYREHLVAFVVDEVHCVMTW